MATKPKPATAGKKPSKSPSKGGSSRPGSGSGGMSQMAAMMHSRVTSGGVKSGGKGK